MSTFKDAVSINPYFRVKESDMAACKDFLKQFCELVSNEENCLFYNFTFKGDVICCREAYTDAAAVMAHLENCGEALGQFLEIAEVLRIELHGPADEVAKLKEAFDPMNAEYFIVDCGIGR